MSQHFYQILAYDLAYRGVPEKEAQSIRARVVNGGGELRSRIDWAIGAARAAPASSQVTDHLMVLL